MKKLFAIFCAVCLMPTFSAQAWIGGPFSNNSYFGQGGEDGIYEAVATGGGTIGIVRFAVGNNFQGVNAAGITQTTPVTVTTVITSGGTTVTTTTNPVASGNARIGAFGSVSNSAWWSAGIFYSAGNVLGTVNSAMGTVFATGIATAAPGPPLRFVFRAGFVGGGAFLPQRAFQGSGTFSIGGVIPAAPGGGALTVFGTKVSDQIFLGT